MTKRMFIKLLAATVASPLVFRWLARAGGERLKNWAGNLEYSTDRLYTATSLEQVRSYVKKENKLKVLGTRHCFNNIADSKNSFLSLKPMNEVIVIDPAARTVKVGAGITYGTDWQKQRINEVWIKSRVEPEVTFDATPEFFGAKRATRNLHPIAELSAENCTEQMGVPGLWYERLPHFRMGFTPSAGKELQSEYFVPRQHAIEAILAIERLRDQVSPHLLISEIRAIAADKLWMSPCYEQSSVTIHFTWKQDWAAVSKLLPVLEKELAPFQARPHWGKLFMTSSTVLRGAYKRMPEFIELSRKYDPEGKFRNEFLNKNIFGN
jgi:hypothetical protein